MSFGAPIGLLALLAVPAILALHLFRRRLQQRTVSGLFLWQSIALRAESGRKRTRLLRSPSLWAELALALLLGLWLADPQFGVDGEPEHLVLILDDSASMAAREPGSESTRARAEDFAGRLLDEIGRSARVTVVATGRRPEVRCGPRALSFEAERALAEWRPSNPSHSFDAAIDLALQLAGPEDRVVLLTDHRVSSSPRVELRAFGTPLPNAAIATVRVDPEDPEAVFVDLQSFGLTDPDAELIVSGRADSRESGSGDEWVRISRQSVAIDPSRVTRLRLRAESRSRELRIELRASSDGLSIDDRVDWLQPERPPVSVAITGSVKDLASGSVGRDLDRFVLNMTGVVAAGSLAAADFVVCMATEESRLGPGQQALVLEEPVGEVDSFTGPFRLDHRSRFSESLQFDGVLWTAMQRDPQGRPLVQVGSRTLLAVDETPAGAFRLRLNLDFSKTNLTSAPDWPILLDQALRETTARRRGVRDPMPPLGGRIAFRPAADDDPSRFELRDQAGIVIPLSVGRELSARAEATGIHQLSLDGDVIARFAPRFRDARESDLRDASSLVRSSASGTSGGSAGAVGRDSLERRVLGLLALLVLGLDWWFLRRRS